MVYSPVLTRALMMMSDPLPLSLSLVCRSPPPPSLSRAPFPALHIFLPILPLSLSHSILCDCEIALVIFNSQGKLTQYASGMCVCVYVCVCVYDIQLAGEAG